MRELWSRTPGQADPGLDKPGIFRIKNPMSDDAIKLNYITWKSYSEGDVGVDFRKDLQPIKEYNNSIVNQTIVDFRNYK